MAVVAPVDSLWTDPLQCSKQALPSLIAPYPFAGATAQLIGLLAHYQGVQQLPMNLLQVSSRALHNKGRERKTILMARALCEWRDEDNVGEVKLQMCPCVP